MRRGAASSSSSSSPSNDINHRLCAASSSRPLQSPPSAATRSGGATYERVLRYPDGLVSRLVGLRKEKMGTERTENARSEKEEEGMQKRWFEGTRVCFPLAPLVAFLLLARGCSTILSMLCDGQKSVRLLKA